MTQSPIVITAGNAAFFELVQGCIQSIRDCSEGRAPWSLFLIDGDHSGSQPVQDAIPCERYAANDALILLHDLTSPDVAAALDYLRKSGWQTMV